MKPLMHCPRCKEPALKAYQKVLWTGWKPSPCRTCGHDFIITKSWTHLLVEIALLIAILQLKSPWLRWPAFLLLVVLDILGDLFFSKLKIPPSPGVLDT